MFECIRMTTNDIIYNTQGVVELLAGCFLLVTWGFRCAKWCLKWCLKWCQGSFQVFTNDILPSDIKQGALGDCWFLAALAAVAEDPDLIRRLLGDPKVNKHGVYEACLRFVEQKIQPWKKKTWAVDHRWSILPGFTGHAPRRSNASRMDDQHPLLWMTFFLVLPTAGCHVMLMLMFKAKACVSLRRWHSVQN